MKSRFCHYGLCDLELVTPPLWACYPTCMRSKEHCSSVPKWVFVSITVPGC